MRLLRTVIDVHEEDSLLASLAPPLLRARPAPSPPRARTASCARGTTRWSRRWTCSAAIEAAAKLNEVARLLGSGPRLVHRLAVDAQLGATVHRRRKCVTYSSGAISHARSRPRSTLSLLPGRLTSYLRPTSDIRRSRRVGRDTPF